jgi:hypothetical protein
MLPIQEIVVLCEALNAKSRIKMGEQCWTHEFFLIYESKEKQWRAVITNYIIQVDGEINGSYEVAEAAAESLKEAIAELMKSKEIERRLNGQHHSTKQCNKVPFHPVIP